MTKNEALQLLESHLKTDSLKKHCFATEAIMRELADVLHADKELWGLAGLLHDLDFELTRETPEVHGLKTLELLAPYALPQEALDAIVRHNAEMVGQERSTPFDLALTCAETMTGLIAAAALVHPDKRVASLNPKSVQKRMKSKDFARNVNRAHIALCEQLGIPLTDFVQLSLKAMTSIGDELGL